MIALIIVGTYGLLPPVIEKFKNKTGALLSIFAGISPYLFILAFEGKIEIPKGADFITWGLLIASAPAFVLSAVSYSKSKSTKARNAAWVGSVIGAGCSIYVWTLLAGFGV